MRMGMGVPKKKTRSERKEVKPVFYSEEKGSSSSQDRSPHWEVGKMNCNLVGTVYGPILERLAEEGSEKYAHDLLEYTEALKQKPDNETVVNPPSPSLFATKMNLEDFKLVLEETTQHFTSSTVNNSSKKKSRKKSSATSTGGDGLDGTNGWKVHANAAKFERLLDEKYGPFRPLMDRMPQLELFIRNTQRKMAKASFSPFRETRPLPIHTSMVLLFMMQRNKVRWEVLVLASIFFLTGLHPWALVTLVAGGRFLFNKRKRKNVAHMPTKIKLCDPYYATSNDSTVDVEYERKKKYELLKQPVGTPLPADLFKDAKDSAEYDVLIIGSGVTALYTAALLSRSGRQVLVLSSNEDASDCRTLQKSPTKLLQELPFDVDNNNVSYVDKMQRLLAPALCTKSDCQGGVRFATIGSENDAFAHDIFSIPGMGTTTSSNSDLKDTDPFLVHAGSPLHLANDAAISLSDGWPQNEDDTANSTTLAYLSVCQTLAADSMEFYTSKLFPESVNQARSKNQYAEAGQRTASVFLDQCLSLNPHVRSLMAGLGMSRECLAPSRTSMAAAITNILSITSPQGQAYPIGGPRALCHALTAVIESNGGHVYTNSNPTELLFRSADTKDDQPKSKESDGDSGDAPRCIGVKLSDGRSILVSSDNEEEEDGVVICTDGFLPTFIQRLPDDLRMKHGVPKGLPALNERRPLIHMLLALDGTKEDLSLTGADWYRLPNASLALDEIDPTTKHITCGIIGAETLTNDDLQNTTTTTSTSNDENAETNDDLDAVNMATDHNKSNHNKKKDTRNYFTTGSSWMKVSFPSAKDPSWNDRFSSVSTCVVTVEADNDTCREFSTKPRIFSILENRDAKMRLMDRISKDLLDNFPQLTGKIQHSELHGPFRAGLSHTPERYAAKGVRPLSPYPGLYMGGTDLTMGSSFSGAIVAGWLVSNAVIGYSFLDQMFLDKDIITDLIQNMETPSTTTNNNEEQHLAVPFTTPNATKDKTDEQPATAAESSKEE